jgi:hypothetical protein
MIIIIILTESCGLNIYNGTVVFINSARNKSLNFNFNKEFSIRDESIVEIEVDIKRKKILYSINNKRCLYYVLNLSSTPLLFGIKGYNTNGILEVISIQKNFKCSTDNLDEFKGIEWAASPHCDRST